MAKDAEVRLHNHEDPEIYWNGKWTPICGHFFWDNDNGAKLFCQKLGLVNGKIKGKGSKLTDDAIRIGKCSDSDKHIISFLSSDGWGISASAGYGEVGISASAGYGGGISASAIIAGCTGGCNDLKVGGYCVDNENGFCTKGQPAKIEIECNNDGLLTVLLGF